MKNWKKYALASASVICCLSYLAACGNLTGNNKKSATTEDGKPIIKMYQSVINQITDVLLKMQQDH